MYIPLLQWQIATAYVSDCYHASGVRWAFCCLSLVCIFGIPYTHALASGIWLSWWWDRLGPGTLCCSVAMRAWDKHLLSNKIQRNYKGLKITVCIRSWGKFWTTRYKETEKPNCHFPRAGAKPGYHPCPLHSTPPKGRANHLSYPSGPTPGHTSYTHPI